jgi:preprotein translocase subunit YajC
LANTTQANATQADTPVSDKLYKAEYVGSGTFIISKPKRRKTKQRQSNLKNVRRGSRK